MSHYTIGYHDSLQVKHEICEYASNAYEAIQEAKEDVPELEGHPHFIDSCSINPTEIDNITRLMASGIPMGH